MELKQFKVIAPRIDAEVAAVFEKYGLKVGKRSATIDSLEGTVSFRLTLIDTNLKDASGNATTPEAARFAKNADYIGLKAEMLGQTFKNGAKTHTVVGLRSGRSAKPVLVSIDGKPGNYVMSVDAVRRAFGLPSEGLVEVKSPFASAQA